MSTPKRAINGTRANSNDFSCGVTFRSETGAYAVSVSICEIQKVSVGLCVHFLAA